MHIQWPSIPKLLSLAGHAISGTASGLLPAEFNSYLKLMSIGFVLRRTVIFEVLP